MEEEKEKPRPFTSDPGRIRRESRPDAAIGSHITAAAAEADARVIRALQGPPPTEEEQAIIAASPREPATIFARVLLTDLETGDRETWRIVPHDEGDLAAGKISVGSPLGRALLQEYPGAVVASKTPAGKRLYRLLRVEA